MKTSELRLDALKIIRETDCYGYEIQKRLSAKGIQIDTGRLYKILTEMLTEGLVGCRWEKGNKGPEKRVYVLREKGRKELDKKLLNAIDTIHERYSEYLLSLPIQTSIFEVFATLAALDLETGCKIAFFTCKISPIHKRILTMLREKLPGSEVYSIHPKEVKSKLVNQDFISLHGDYWSIPLREKYIDLLIIESLPCSQNLLKAVEEWHRILKEESRLVIITPKALFFTYKDPLSIGEFIERIEHQNNGKESIRIEILIQLLEKFFRNVQKKEALNMTFLLARKTEGAFLN